MTRTTGGIQLFSKESLMKNATPRKSARPPIQAKSFTPMNCSQLTTAGSGGDGETGGTGGGWSVAATKGGSVRSSETGVGSTIGGGGWIAGVVAAPAGASIAAISGGNAGAGVCSGAAEAGAGLVAGGAGGPAVLGVPSSARSFWNAIVWSSRRVSNRPIFRRRSPILTTETMLQTSSQTTNARTQTTMNWIMDVRGRESMLRRIKCRH